MRNRLAFIFMLFILMRGYGETFAFAQHTSILFLGDSLTAGWNIEKTAAYPALIEKCAAAEGISLEAVNGGLSGDVSAGGLRRLPWLLKGRSFDIVFLALGANDGLRGHPPAELKANLIAIIDSVRAKNPDTKVVLAGMRLPQNYGKDYIAGFEAVFPAVAKEKKVYFMPFLLDGVAGDPALNFDDMLHPTEKGHSIIAEKVWQALKPLIESTPSNPKR